MTDDIFENIGLFRKEKKDLEQSKNIQVLITIIYFPFMISKKGKTNKSLQVLEQIINITKQAFIFDIFL